jgi:hypothetical protein
VSFPYVLPMAGGTPGNSSGSAFQILKDPPLFNQGLFQDGTIYNVNAVVEGSDGNFYRALCANSSDPVSGGNPYWALVPGPPPGVLPQFQPFGIDVVGTEHGNSDIATTATITPGHLNDFAVYVSSQGSAPSLPAGWEATSGIGYWFAIKQLSGRSALSASQDLGSTALWSNIIATFSTDSGTVTIASSTSFNFATGATQTCTVEVEQGQTIIVALPSQGNNDTQPFGSLTITDDKGNSYQIIQSNGTANIDDTSFYSGAWLGVAVNCPAGTTTLTLTLANWFASEAPNGYVLVATGLRQLASPFSDGLIDVRNYCAANSIYASVFLNSQRSCADILGEICEIANCTPVWNGQALDFYPYSEVSCIGGGVVYRPRTANGPLATFDSNYFVMEKDTPPVTVKQDDMQSVYNILDINFTEAGFDIYGACGYQSYQSQSVRVCDAEHCMLYGPMNAAPKGYDDYLTDSVAATAVGWPILKRQRFADPYSVEFELPQTIGSLIDPMDLFTLVDPIFGGTLTTGVQTSGSGQQDVRITELSEDKDGTWTLSAERFMYGMSAPNAPSVTTAIANVPPQLNTLAGSVDAPYFFEPTAALAVALGMSAEGGVCIAVTGSASNYGGCVVNVSTDGGNSYAAIGRVNGNPNMGVVTADYPLAPSPDNTDNLEVDLTQSEGELQSYTSAQQAQLVPIGLVDNSGAPGTGSSAGYTTTVPYEIVAYQDVTLTATYKYTLSPPILRGQLGTVPADHPSAGSPPAPSVFVDLSTSNSIFKYILPNSQIAGNVLYFKFQTFNQFGTGLQDISDCTAYTYTITGQTNPTSPSSPAAGGSYTVSPNPCLYQGRSGGWSGIDSGSSGWTSTDDIYFPPITVNLSSGAIIYNANDTGTAAFTGPNQTVYVCIYDPTQAGGTPTVDVQSTNEHALSPGYFYLGQITSAAAPTAPGSAGGSSAPGGPQDTGTPTYVIEVNGVPVPITNE